MKQVRAFTSSALEPYARGVEFGALHRLEVTGTVAAYRRLFAARATEPFDVDAWAEHAWEAIGELAPWACEEIRGIADGVGVPVREIAALNARTELLAVANPTGVAECSTVVSLPSGRPPVGVQTWDWYDAMSDGWLHWGIPLPDGRFFSTVTEYGVLAKIGVNSDGLGVLLNMLHHASDATTGLGYPVHLLSRRILETASNVDDAVRTVQSVTTSASTSLTVLDAAGRAASLELSPDGVNVVEPEDGLLVRTNHFVSEVGRKGCLASTIGPGSEIRHGKLLDTLTDSPAGSSDAVVDAMLDHDEVGGVCAHPDRSMEPVLQHATLATVVVDVANRSLGVSDGGPCAATLSLSSRT